MTNSSLNDRPWTRPITDNERDWIEFLRLITHDRDPPVTFHEVQALRRVFEVDQTDPDQPQRPASRSDMD